MVNLQEKLLLFASGTVNPIKYIIMQKLKQTAKEKKNLKDATKMKNMRPTGPSTNRVKTTMGSAKNGTSLGMKSVKAGFDKNPGVTRADIITAATKKAKSGTKMKKAMMGAVAKPMMKSGGSMKKCKYGCK